MLSFAFYVGGMTVDVLLVNARDAARLLGISRSQFYMLLSSGRVPAPLRLGTAAPRWRLDELKQWVAAGAPSRDAWEAQGKDHHRV